MSEPTPAFDSYVAGCSPIERALLGAMRRALRDILVGEESLDDPAAGIARRALREVEAYALVMRETEPTVVCHECEAKHARGDASCPLNRPKGGAS